MEWWEKSEFWTVSQQTKEGENPNEKITKKKKQNMGLVKNVHKLLIIQTEMNLWRYLHESERKNNKKVPEA